MCIEAYNTTPHTDLFDLGIFIRVDAQPISNIASLQVLSRSYLVCLLPQRPLVPIMWVKLLKSRLTGLSTNDAVSFAEL